MCIIHVLQDCFRFSSLWWYCWSWCLTLSLSLSEPGRMRVSGSNSGSGLRGAASRPSNGDGCCVNRLWPLENVEFPCWCWCSVPHAGSLPLPVHVPQCRAVPVQQPTAPTLHVPLVNVLLLLMSSRATPFSSDRGLGAVPSMVAFLS